MENQIVEMLPDIDLDLAMSMAIDILASPTFYPMLLLFFGATMFFLFLVVAVEVPIYILQRLGVVLPTVDSEIVEEYDRESVF